MHSRFTRLAGTAVLTGFSLASFSAVAPSAARADEQDPGVARISSLSGGVDVKRADSGDTLSAAVNAPLNAGDYLTTQDGARAELQLDDLTELRVAPDTQLRFTTLTSDSNALQLAQGTVELRLFRGNGANPEIDTPNATVRPSGNGAFRVTVDNEGNAIVTARSGEATVATQNDSQRIPAGSSVAVEGNAGGAQFRSVGFVANDDFDAFNSDRDRHEADSPSYAYVNDQFVGADDLDRYGSWQNVDGYGEVWHPHYAADWAPYQDGNWTWEPYYGWTWVSAEPWGWAPYHYGRWFYAANNGGWCWTPATHYFAPVYRPAQVAFFSFGFGGGGGISIGIGNVGWVALGPTDTFRPWWGRNGQGGNGYGGNDYGGYGGRRDGGNTTIVNNITNVTNVTNINNYHNINAPGGIVAVRNTNFRNGEFRQRLSITPAQLRTANIGTVRGVVPIVPTTRNLAYTGAAPSAKRFPLSGTFDRFKQSTAPTTSTFAEQRAAVSTVAQRAYPTEAKNFEREAPTLLQHASREPSAPNAPAQRAATRTVPVVNGSRFSTAESQPAPETRTTSPWDRFAKPSATTDLAKPNSTNNLAKPNTNDLAKPSTTYRGALPKVTNVQATDGEPARSAQPVQQRPSYARPDSTEYGTTGAPRASTPQVQNVNAAHAAGSPWDRFGATARAAPSASAATRSTSTRDGDALPATHGADRTTHSTPADSESIHPGGYGNAASEPVTRRYSAPAAAPLSSSAQTNGSHTYQQPVERAARVERAVPVERAAPVEHAAPATRAAPAAHAAPAERAAPTEHSASAEHAASSDGHASAGDHADTHHERK